MATGRLLVGNVQFKITTLLIDDGNVHDNAYIRRKESLNLSVKMLYSGFYFEFVKITVNQYSNYNFI